MAKQTDATWFEIDPSTLDETAKRAYDTYKALYRQAKEARQSFETIMQGTADLAQGKRMIFGYNFGKLSVAVVNGEAKSEAKPKLGLAQFLASQASQGRRA